MGRLKDSKKFAQSLFPTIQLKISITAPSVSASIDNYKQYSLCPPYYSTHEDTDPDNLASDTYSLFAKLER